MRGLTSARWSTERFHADSRLDQGPRAIRGDLHQPPAQITPPQVGIQRDRARQCSQPR
jgi:hypothetical protein